MTPRMIALTAAVSVAVLTAVDLALLTSLSDGGRFWYYVTVRTGLFALVAICAAVAAQRFGWWDEHVGRAWTLFFTGYALLVLSEIVKRFLPDISVAQETLLGAANLAIIGAYWLYARSFRMAGLKYYGSPAKRIAFIAAAVLLSVLLVQASAMTALQSLRSAQPHPGQLVSAIADLVTFLLAAPLVLTAYSFRGGDLFWTFALLTTGTFGWMFNQGSSRVFRLLGHENAVAAGRNFGFAMACCFIAAAALVQWLGAHRATNNEVQHA